MFKVLPETELSIKTVPLAPLDCISETPRRIQESEEQENEKNQTTLCTCLAKFYRACCSTLTFIALPRVQIYSSLNLQASKQIE